MKRKNTLVYILSASHSGSTVLSLLLGTHPLFVNLGEIATTFFRWEEQQHRCTCNSEAKECVIWGGENGYRQPGAALSDDYNLLISRCREIYPSTPYIVDASKDVNVLNSIKDQIDSDLKVVFLQRDPRGYISSIQRKNADKKGGVVSRITLSHPYLLRYWLKINTQFQQYLEKNNVGFIKITYEDLCLDSTATMSRVSEFLEVEPSFSFSGLGNSTSHILRGNGMRFQKRLLAGIRYDYRWMRDSNHLFYPLLFKFVSKRIRALMG